jgi:hypothetical protein
MSSIETRQMNRRFDGYRHTPLLWEAALEGLTIYTADKLPIADYPKIDVTSPIRLGKLIEQFVLLELEQDESTQVLKSNVQIFREQITIGELDCLIRKIDEHIHLEIVYKFYLYDPSVSTELTRWIGPNRKDSLVLKLDKLKDKQLPLLYRPETAKVLDELETTAAQYRQRVCFKAQLFVPLNMLETSFALVNNDCIIGFYLRAPDLNLFSDYTFYIPTKLDWLVVPHAEVPWVALPVFQGMLSELLAAEKSPLCWMKSSEGMLQKLFVVWWK